MIFQCDHIPYLGDSSKPERVGACGERCHGNDLSRLSHSGNPDGNAGKNESDFMVFWESPLWTELFEKRLYLEGISR